MKIKLLFKIGCTFLLIFICYFFCSSDEVSAKAPYVAFSSEYAQAGIPLTVKDHYYPRGTDFSYTWAIDNVVIENEGPSYTPDVDDIGKLITVTVTPDNGSPETELRMLFSELPVLYINTLDNGPIYSKVFYFEANMTMQGNSLYNSSTSEEYNGPILIKGRGNTTWHHTKLPYRIKLETDTNLFHLGSSKHWVLLANALDPSLMRNKISYDLSGAIGMPYMESTWVDVVLNDVYVGNYLLCEQVRIDENRIDITDLEEYIDYAVDTLIETGTVSISEEIDLKNHMEWHMEWLTTKNLEYNGQNYDLSSLSLPEITGGFLFELDAFYDEPSKFKVNNQSISIRSPKYIGTNSTVMQFAYDYVSAFYDAAYCSPEFYTNYQGTATHYSQLFDITSLAQYFLINEIFFNEDAGAKSTFFYKDLTGPAHMGPVWDMDYSSGGQGDNAHLYDQWQTVYYSNYAQDNQWYKGLIRDPYFLSQALSLWQSYRNDIFHVVADDGPMEEAYDYLLSSAQANDRIWSSDGSFEQSYLVFKNWLIHRLEWLDQQFTDLDTLVDSIAAYEKGADVTMTHTVSDTVTVTAPTGSYAVFFYNGIWQAQLPIENGTVSWTYTKSLYTDESDVIVVRVYSDDSTFIGSAYLDFRN